MRLIAANGPLVLTSAAVYLQSKAAAGRLDAGFYVVQVLELAAGAIQLALLGRNFLDGLRLAGRLRRTPHFAGPGF